MERPHQDHLQAPIRRTTPTTPWVIAAAMLSLGVAGNGASAQQPPSQQGQPATRGGDSVAHNPRSLRAVQLLERLAPGEKPQVRFEWDQVSGVSEYMLIGHWTQSPSWTIQSFEYRVSRRNAAMWGPVAVRFEVRLPPGSHSWKVMSVDRKQQTDSVNATLFSFDVR